MRSACWWLLLVLLVPARGGDARPPAEEGKVVVLEPMKVKGKPIISFGVDLRIYMDPDTRKVDRIFITRVREKTDAEEAGLQVGDEIVKFDGAPVKSYDAKVGADTPLGKLLLNRRPGEPLRIEVIKRRTESVTLRALVPAPPDGG